MFVFNSGLMFLFNPAIFLGQCGGRLCLSTVTNVDREATDRYNYLRDDLVPQCSSGRLLCLVAT